MYTEIRPGGLIKIRQHDRTLKAAYVSEAAGSKNYILQWHKFDVSLFLIALWLDFVKFYDFLNKIKQKSI
jgi:hypothetical protein